VEVKALLALRGLEGVPQIVRRDSPSSYIASYEEGIPISEAVNLSPEYFERLERMMSFIHARGVVDMDLVHEGDTRINKAGRPVVLDFGLAWTFSQSHSRIGEAFFRFFSRQHHIHLLEIKNRYFPEDMTPDEKRIIKTGWSLPKIQRALHRLRWNTGVLFSCLYKLLKRFLHIR
jgi:hypothetical protein